MIFWELDPFFSCNIIDGFGQSYCDNLPNSLGETLITSRQNDLPNKLCRILGFSSKYSTRSKICAAQRCGKKSMQVGIFPHQSQIESIHGASNVAWKICFFKFCLGSWIIGFGFQADRTLLVAVSATRQSRNYIATGRTLITDHSPILAQLLVQKLPLLFPPQKFSQGCSGKGSLNKSLGMKRLTTFKLLKLLYNEVPFVLYRLLSEVFQPFQQALDVILA